MPKAKKVIPRINLTLALPLVNILNQHGIPQTLIALIHSYIYGFDFAYKKDNLFNGVYVRAYGGELIRELDSKELTGTNILKDWNYSDLVYMLAANCQLYKQDLNEAPDKAQFFITGEFGKDKFYFADGEITTDDDWVNPGLYLISELGAFKIRKFLSFLEKMFRHTVITVSEPPYWFCAVSDAFRLKEEQI